MDRQTQRGEGISGLSRLPLLFVIFFAVIMLVAAILIAHRKGHSVPSGAINKYALAPPEGSTLLGLHSEAAKSGGILGIETPASATSFWASLRSPEDIASWYLNSYGGKYHLSRDLDIGGNITLSGLMPMDSRAGVRVTVRGDQPYVLKGDAPPKGRAPPGTRSYITVTTTPT